MKPRILIITPNLLLLLIVFNFIIHFLFPKWVVYWSLFPFSMTQWCRFLKKWEISKHFLPGYSVLEKKIFLWDSRRFFSLLWNLFKCLFKNVFCCYYSFKNSEYCISELIRVFFSQIVHILILLFRHGGEQWWALQPDEAFSVWDQASSNRQNIGKELLTKGP